MSVGPVNETGLLSKPVFCLFFVFYQTRSSGTGETGPEKLLVLQKGLGIVTWARVPELCESPGGRPGLSVLTSLLVSVDV